MKKSKKTSRAKATIHTLHNYLTSINLSAELLLKEFYGAINGKQKKYLKVILSEAKKIQTLVKKIK